MKMITYEIRKKFDDGHDVCYFTAYDFDETMQMLWENINMNQDVILS